MDRRKKLTPRGWLRSVVPGPPRGRGKWRVPGLRRARRPASGDSWAWLEPYPGPFTGPPARAMSLAFVAALQRLPPDERAALVLSDVLDFGAEEVADMVGCAAGDVDSLLTRARAKVGVVLSRPSPEAPPLPEPIGEDEVVAMFAAAFDRGDVPGIAALLTDDAWLRMRPLPVQYQGRAAARHFLAAVAFPGGTARYRLVATRANDQPAFGCYLRDPVAGVDRACGLVVLTVHGGRIAGIDRFVDNSALPGFGLPRSLPGTTAPEAPASG